MRTGEMIQELYEIEHKRIIQELEDIIPSLDTETEIIKMQHSVKEHKTETLSGIVCHFNCSGAIVLYLPDSNGSVNDWSRGLASCYKSNFIQELDLDKLKSYGLNLKTLKKIHPKILHEVLLYSAKNILI